MNLAVVRETEFCGLRLAGDFRRWRTQKLRRAMVDPDCDLLEGVVEVDQTEIPRFRGSMAGLMLPCRRFADVLADACARLGADVGRYSFIAVDSHGRFRVKWSGSSAHQKTPVAVSVSKV